MAIYKRDDVAPEWEPIPYDAKGRQVDAQEKGFHARALKPLVWTKVDWNDFPAEGIFGQDREWFSRNDISYITTFDGEDLILIQRVWFGFPDPPEWGLASRPAGSLQTKWEMWGSFPDLPVAWVFPEEA
jgi:hypothetical protein